MPSLGKVGAWAKLTSHPQGVVGQLRMYPETFTAYLTFSEPFTKLYTSSVNYT